MSLNNAGTIIFRVIFTIVIIIAIVIFISAAIIQHTEEKTTEAYNEGIAMGKDIRVYEIVAAIQQHGFVNLVFPDGTVTLVAS